MHQHYRISLLEGLSHTVIIITLSTTLVTHIILMYISAQNNNELYVCIPRKVQVLTILETEALPQISLFWFLEGLLQP